MEVTTISLEDLVRECNIDDPAEFRRLLRRNAFLSVSANKPIDRRKWGVVKVLCEAGFPLITAP